MAPAASKPRPTIIARRNIRYVFLCDATPTSLDTVRKQHGLMIQGRSKNGNAHLMCSSRHSSQLHPCTYRGLFVAEYNAIYEIKGREHNHTVNVRANEAEEGEGTSAAANAPQQDHQAEYNDEDESEDDEDQDEAMEEEPQMEEEADDHEQKPVLNNEGGRLSVDVRDENHLAQLRGLTVEEAHGSQSFKQEAMQEADEELMVVEEKRLLDNIRDTKQLAEFCDAATLEETERIFECKHPNCPYRASFMTKERKLFVFNHHKHIN